MTKGAAKLGGAAKRAADASSKDSSKPARDALKELSALRDEKLISESEWEGLRAKVLDQLVARAAVGSGGGAGS